MPRLFQTLAKNRILLLAVAILLLISGTAEAKKKKSHRAPSTAKRPAAPRIVAPKPTPTPEPTPAKTELAPGELPLAAKGAVLIDALTGDTLYEKNQEQAFYPASTTKILTALLVIEEGNLDKPVTVALEDTKAEPTSLEMKVGEVFTRKQMLYGMMLKSANDVAWALARDNAGSIEAFAEKMNKRAAELGATSSHFANPNGLHNIDHFTTPHDLSLIARTAMEQPFFRQVVSTQKFDWITTHGVVELTNHNKLLWKYPGCTGLKTGYTYPAQQVLVSSALRDGREVISVVMHTDKPGIWVDSETLLTYGFSHLHSLSSEY